MDAAAQDYLQDLEEAKDAYIAAYIQGCKDAVAGQESFTMQYERSEYWYTLYYYDQAGNLIKTVPPAGVDFLDNSAPGYDLDAVKDYRAGVGGSVFTVPTHSLVSQYTFNSLQNTTAQTTPDGGTSTFYYDYLGRMVLSQNAQQATASQYSFTKYDALGRPCQAGQVTNTVTVTQATVSAAADYATWQASNTNTEQVVNTYYDAAIPGSGTNDYVSGGQENLRNRVSSVTYEETDDGSDLTFDNASHYSYDIHGSVKTLVQHNTAMGSTGQNKKRIDYEYDLISGNVNKVSYQDGQADRFYHRYYYDADNRLTRALSSHDGTIWETESKNFYYPHGPLARMETGDRQVAGHDYAYTLQGWIKGVNSNTLKETRDIGSDGKSGNINQEFAKDAFGYTLGYFTGDYSAIGTINAFEASNPTSAGYGFGHSIKGLYNGTISNMTSTQLKTDETQLDILGNVYQYDQLYRIKQADRYTDQSNLVTSNTWSTTATTNSDMYKETFTFDFNGNITALTRNNNSSGSALAMDNLTYSYLTIGGNKSNQLGQVTDDVASGSFSDDIDDQASQNYFYNSNGELTQDNQEDINTIEWTVRGKIKSIVRNSTSTKSDLFFTYDATDNRICKLEKPRNGSGYVTSNHFIYTYYVRDAALHISCNYEK